MKHKMIITMLAVALMALHATAQTYRIQGTAYRAQTAVPSMAFQSTGSMVPSGSAYSSNPLLGEDGTATYDGASYSSSQTPSGPRRASVFDDDDEDMPIGDGLWAMMLLAGAYLCGRVFLRRRRALKG